MNRAEQHWLEVKIIRNQRLVVVNKNTNLNKEGFKTWSCVHHILSSVKEKLHFSSVTQSCPTLCDPMDCSTPGLPVHHQLLEFAQTHIHWIGDVIQSSHPLLSPSSPAFNLSQHQGLFKWVSFSHQMAKVLEFQLQHQSFQWTPRTDWCLKGSKIQLAF